MFKIKTFLGKSLTLGVKNQPENNSIKQRAPLHLCYSGSRLLLFLFDLYRDEKQQQKDQ